MLLETVSVVGRPADRLGSWAVRSEGSHSSGRTRIGENGAHPERGWRASIGSFPGPLESHTARSEASRRDAAGTLPLHCIQGLGDTMGGGVQKLGDFDRAQVRLRYA